METYGLYKLAIIAAISVWLQPDTGTAAALKRQSFMPLNIHAMKNRVVEAEPYDDSKSKKSGSVDTEAASTEGFMPLNRTVVRATGRLGKGHRTAARKVSGSSNRKARKRRPLELVDLNESDSAVLRLFGDDEISKAHPFASRMVGNDHAWPIGKREKQYISSEFGIRKDPFTGEKAFHQGIDIAAQKGTPVRASARGKVIGVGKHPRLGNYVKIEHENGVTSQYGHLKQAAVRGGQAVRRGQVIGKVGSTGRSTGPHLDYSIRIDGKPIDPLTRLIPPAHLKPLELSSSAH